jgi:DNA-binding transcriptional LysR family regulator
LEIKTYKKDRQTRQNIKGEVMTLTQMLYAVKIAETKSMNKAASELFVTQPALSSTIRDLEEEIHTRIFIRTSKGIVVTTEGEDFLSYARQMLEINNMMEERFIHRHQTRINFSVSMQHYSFAVEAFITLAREFKIEEYELAIHETKTHEVIENVKNFRSEIGVLYLNEFNQKVMQRIFSENGLEFEPLFQCGTSVYLYKKHPLADRDKINFEELVDYPFLSFEQGDRNSFYFAEEMFSLMSYKQIIKVDDRATMLNLMVGMNGFTLCSGLICGDLNGEKYVSVPLDTEDKMMIGYIKRKNIPLSALGEKYIDILKKYDGQEG